MKLLKTSEAAKLFQVTRATIINWSNRDKIKKYVSPQGKTFYEVDLETYEKLKHNLDAR